VTFAAALAVAVASPAAAFSPQSQDSVAYQINNGHSGKITFSTPFSAPLKKAWSVKFQGTLSYPIVADGVVIVSVNSSGNTPALLVALDLKTGAVKWQKAEPYSYSAYDKGKLFFTNFSGPLQAVEARTGAQIWSTQLPYQFFFNYVPVAGNGSVFTGGDESGVTLYQVDEETGVLGWSQELAGGGAGVTLGDGKVFFAIPCDVAAFTPTSGSLVWNWSTGCDGGGGAVAAYYRGRVYAPGVNIESGLILNAATGAVTGNLNSNSLLPAFSGSLAFSVSGSDVLATKLSSSNLAWLAALSGTFSEPPIVVNDLVFALNTAGELYVLDAATGVVKQKIMVGLGGGTAAGYGDYGGMGAGEGYVVVPSGAVLAAFKP
jgi:outer membrane protein assembly factor BamB